MITDIFFQNEGAVKIDAAVAGISRYRWVAVQDGKEDHKELMAKYRFDVIPIEPADQVVTEYYTTIAPGKYEEVERRSITYSDVIPLDTPIREVIYRFAEENRHFFFLSYQNQVSGLISLSNLNCRQVKIYLFSLICELEIRLSRMVQSQVGTEKILAYLRALEDNGSESIGKILQHYQAAVEQEYDNDITEFLYLSDFLNLALKWDLHKQLVYSRNKWDDLGGLNELRNLVAHPTNALVSKKHPVDKLWSRIQRLEDALFRLRQWELKNGK